MKDMLFSIHLKAMKGKTKSTSTAEQKEAVIFNLLRKESIKRDDKSSSLILKLISKVCFFNKKVLKLLKHMFTC
jgi:hypothetical protein